VERDYPFLDKVFDDTYFIEIFRVEHDDFDGVVAFFYWEEEVFDHKFRGEFGQ
jgi:hypothetical protein